jgi:hypothetical protein
MPAEPPIPDVFCTWVKHALVPELTAGDVVILDNLHLHKAAGVREMIQAVGATLLYLPPYSPDFNPVEPMWSKVKQHLQSAAAGTFKGLQEAVTEALDGDGQRLPELLPPLWLSRYGKRRAAVTPSQVLSDGSGFFH